MNSRKDCLNCGINPEQYAFTYLEQDESGYHINNKKHFTPEHSLKS